MVRASGRGAEPAEAIARHAFTSRKDPVEKFFASAGIGRESRQADRAAAERRLQWDQALKEVTSQAAILLECDNSWVTIFHNTTGAIQRIFSRLAALSRMDAGTLLTTNVEYPGIMALLLDSWYGQVAVADIGAPISAGQSEQAMAVLRAAVLATRPSVFFVSHVVRSSGFVIPDSFLEFVREVHPRCVVVVDGAQAIGNVRVDPRLLEKGVVDFYVTSGQKWLCGRPTLSLVWCNPRWRVHDPSQSYTKFVGSGGTGDVRALRSLAVALKDFNGAISNCSPHERLREVSAHNASLAKYFCSRLEELGLADRLQPLPLLHKHDWHWNGIVSIWRSGESLGRALGRKGFTVSTIHQETSEKGQRGFMVSGARPMGDEELVIVSGLEHYDQNGVPQEGCCRICFHYYHSKYDVDRLLDVIVRWAHS